MKVILTHLIVIIQVIKKKYLYAFLISIFFVFSEERSGFLKIKGFSLSEIDIKTKIDDAKSR